MTTSTMTIGTMIKKTITPTLKTTATMTTTATSTRLKKNLVVDGDEL